MKKILAVLLALMLAASFAACSKTNNETPSEAPSEPTETTGDENTDSQSPAQALLAEFKQLVADEKDAEAIAAKLAESDVFVSNEIATGSLAVEEGLLNGFSGEIKGFTKGAMFSPLIGTMPVIGYVFETEDADALVAALKENADLRWNICTQADEMVCENVDGLVFFMMAPASFELEDEGGEVELPEIPDELAPIEGAEIPADEDLGISIG